MSDDKTKDSLIRQTIMETARADFARPRFQPVFQGFESSKDFSDFPSSDFKATLDALHNAVARIRTERISNMYQAQLSGAIIVLDETLPENACTWHVGRKIWDELQQFKQTQG